MGMIYFLTLGVDFSVKNEKSNHILGTVWVLVLCMWADHLIPGLIFL